MELATSSIFSGFDFRFSISCLNLFKGEATTSDVYFVTQALNFSEKVSNSKTLINTFGNILVLCASASIGGIYVIAFCFFSLNS